ncbi:MAG: insulinase family protein [Desulfobacterales bacterium]
MKIRKNIATCMLKAIAIGFLIIFFVTPSGAFAVWPHEKSDLKPDPEVVWGKLDNDFRYVLMKNTQPKDRVGMHLNVQVGSIHERENERGLAHFLEHMLFQGTENFDPGELVKYFQSIGMQFGPDVNAYTSFQETVYHIILPEGNAESIRNGLQVIKDYARGALLLKEQIDSEKKVVLSEKQSRDSASYRIFEETLKFEFPESRISSRLPIGDEDVIRKLDQGMVRDFYDSWYRPENMILVMVGDFEFGEVVSLIRKTFSDMTPRAPSRPTPDLGTVRHQGICPFYHFEEKIGDASVGIEVLEMMEEKPDTRAFRERILKKDVADAIVQNRLDSMVSRGNAPFTRASVRSNIFLNRFFYAEISAKSSAEKWEASLSVIEQELRKALKYGFTKAELKRVKQNYISRLETAVQKAPTRDTRELARQIISNHKADRVFMSPEQTRDLYVPMLERFTADDIHKAFRETWNKNHRLLLVTGNAAVSENIEDPEAYVLSVFNKSRNQEVSPEIESEPAIFPYLSKPETPGKITGKQEFPDLGIIQIDYENGGRLNYKKTDYKVGEILVEVGFGLGKASEPPKKPGLSELSEEVVNKSGVGGLDREDLTRALAGKNTTVKFKVDENRFLFRANTVPDEIDLVFQLLYTRIQDPAFRQEAYQMAMERYRLSYMQNVRSVEGAMKIHAERFLAGGDKRFGLPDYDAYQQLSLNDVRSWIETALHQYPFEISVVGDFNPDILVENVSRYLGGLSSAKQQVEIPKRAEGPNFPEGKSLKLGVDTEIPKAISIVAYPTDDYWDIHRTRRLSVLADVVNEKLRVKIRESLGASYSQYAYNRPSKAYPGYGVFRKVVITSPLEAQNLVDVMRQIASDINTDGISEDQLQRALEPTLSSIREMRRKNEYWLTSVLAGSKKHPEQLDWARSIIDDYSSITRDEILEMAKKFLDNDKSADVIIVPEN